MTAVWQPAAAATSAAIAATTVLPEPTSPCSSRFIGVLAPRVGDDLVERRSAAPRVSAKRQRGAKRSSRAAGLGSGRARSVRAPAAERRKLKRCAMSSSSAMRREHGCLPDEQQVGRGVLRRRVQIARAPRASGGHGAPLSEREASAGAR